MTAIVPPITTTTWSAEAAPDEPDRRVFGHYWRRQAALRQNIIDKQDVRLAEQAQTIAELAASVVQLENDYDQVETELKQLQEKLARPPRRVVIL